MKYNRVPLALEIVSVGLSLIGVVLAVLGTVYPNAYPWITFKKGFVVQLYGQNPWRYIFFEISPFLITYQFQGELVVHEEWFYKGDATLVGLFCVTAAVLSLILNIKKMRRETLLGGLMVMFSILAFGTCLPGMYPYIQWGIGVRIILYSSLLIFTSALLGYISDAKKDKKVLYDNLKKQWETNQIK